MNRLPLRERIGAELARVSRLWRTRLDERLAPLGLTQAKWLSLVLLHRARLEEPRDGLPQRELVERIGVEGPTLVRVLDGLERLGLIERLIDPADRRSKIVRLTPAAEPVIGQILDIAAELRTELLRGISDQQLLVVAEVFDTITANAGPRRERA